MMLGDFVRDYREKHEMSQRDFAKVVGLSAGYISMLESNANPRTGEPITPSITTIKQIADAVGTTVDALLSLMDNDATVSLDAAGEDDAALDAKIAMLVQQLPTGLKMSLIDLLQATVAGVAKK